MRVITLEQVKAQLGILDNSQDVAITAKLPIIDAKVKQITNNRYNMQVTTQLTTGSNIATISSINYKHLYWGNGYNNNGYCIEDLGDYLQIGDQIEGDGIPAETYIEELYYNGQYVTIGGTQYVVPAIKLSANATDNGLQESFVGINIGYHDIIAKGVQYLISGTNTKLPLNKIKSKSLPPLSVTFADSKVDPKTGMPDWFVEALPRFMGGFL